MLITFSCDHFENIVMFENIAKKLLTLMGNSGSVPGAILADDISEALSHLEAGLEQMHERRPSSTKQDEDEEPEISLAQRAIPLISMLKSAMKHHCNVLWK